mmetsp:Transcript_26684/g.4744  ORF Transcript_26684/g.4744 Transcript_26684/m.4744 type:complete len:89 (+) Transcript_26684:1722-1988(+)
MSDSRIKVIPGTQTNDLYISTLIGSLEPLAADQLAFTLSINSFQSSRGSLTITSAKNDYTMHSGEYYINFRISASIDSDQGIYWMDAT